MRGEAAGPGRIVELVQRRAERGVQQRRQLVDVGAEHDHVAGFQRGVVGEQAADGVAHHLDLPGPPVAGVHLDRAVVDGQGEVAGRFPIVADVGLDAGEQGRGRRLVEPMMRQLRVGGGAEHQLHLARVRAPGAQQRVLGKVAGGVVAPGERQRRSRLRGDALPQRQRRVQGVQVHVAVRGQGAQHLQVGGRQAGEPEQRDPGRQVGVGGAFAQPAAGALDPLGRAGPVDQCPDVAPGLGLPGGVGGQVVAEAVAGPAGVPVQHHGRPVDRVAVEQVGQVTGGGEAT